MQESCNSIANALELRRSCINPSWACSIMQQFEQVPSWLLKSAGFFSFNVDLDNFCDITYNSK